MKIFFKYSSVFFLATFAVTFFSAFSLLKLADEPYMVKEFILNEEGNLEVETTGGSIKVSGHQGNAVRVEMYLQIGEKKIAASDVEGKKILEDYHIDISQNVSTISAIAKKKDNTTFNGKNSSSISFALYVPKQVSSKLNTSGGSISLEGVEGNQEVKTSGGSLTFKNIEGKTEGHTSGGSINIANYSGSLNAHTSGDS